jgi:predicted DNA-binding protein
MVDTKRRTSKKGKIRISASLTAEQYEVLSGLAVKKKVSVAWMIREAVDKLIEDMDGGWRLPFDS